MPTPRLARDTELSPEPEARKPRFCHGEEEESTLSCFCAPWSLLVSDGTVPVDCSLAAQTEYPDYKLDNDAKADWHLAGSKWLRRIGSNECRKQRVVCVFLSQGKIVLFTTFLFDYGPFCYGLRALGPSSLSLVGPPIARYPCAGSRRQFSSILGIRNCVYHVYVRAFVVSVCVSIVATFAFALGCTRTSQLCRPRLILKWLLVRTLRTTRRIA